MAGETQNNIWPLPKFYFEVDFGAWLSAVPFQEVSGLDSETQVIEYRHEDTPIFSTVKMPGIAKYGNVTLKKGIFVNDNALSQWRSQIAANTAIKTTITIKLLDEAGKPTMIWVLTNACPTKLSATDLKSSGNEVAVDLVEIAFEAITVQNA